MIKMLFGKKKERFTSANIMGFVNDAIRDLEEEAQEVKEKAQDIGVRQAMLEAEKKTNEIHGKKVETMIGKIKNMFEGE